MGKGKGKQGKGKGNGKNKNKGKGEQHGNKGKKGFHEMEGHDDTQDTQTIQDFTEWTDKSWDHSDNWMARTCGQTIGAQICGLTLHGNKRTDSWHRRNLIQRTEAAFQFRWTVDVRVVSW